MKNPRVYGNNKDASDKISEDIVIYVINTNLIGPDINGSNNKFSLDPIQSDCISNKNKYTIPNNPPSKNVLLNK